MMAQTKCVLDILKQNDFIRTELSNNDFSLKVWVLDLKNITDEDTKKEVIEKILLKMEYDDEYIIGYRWNTSFRFTTKEEMDKMINNFIETGKEREHVKMDEKGFKEWIEEHYNHSIIAHQGGYRSDYSYDLINLEIRKKREEKEKNNDQKVLELLNDIL